MEHDARKRFLWDRSKWSFYDGLHVCVMVCINAVHPCRHRRNERNVALLAIALGRSDE